MLVKYNLNLKRNQTQKYQLPNFKNSSLLLKNLQIVSENRSLDVKLVGKETIFFYGEAVLMQVNNFDLSNHVSQIQDSDELSIYIKNLSQSEISVMISLLYEENSGHIIFNNTYSSLNSESTQNILDDLQNSGKYINKIVWIADQILPSLEFLPKFESQPSWLKPIQFTNNQENQIIMDLTSNEYDFDFVGQLKHYTLKFPKGIHKIGVIVYGYKN